MKSDNVCSNCWDIVLGTGKLPQTEFYRINNKPYCGLTCFYEDYDKDKKETLKVSNDPQTNKSYKRQKQVFKKRVKSKKGKR